MNYIKITPVDTANGLGVHVVLWVAGCEHHCKCCQNPNTWNRDAGQPFTEETMEELIECLDKRHINGITFSGGDPMAPYNRETVLRIIKRIRDALPDKNIWVYTGCLLEELMSDKAIGQKVLENINVLVDGPFVQDLYSIDLWRKGSSNQRVINVPETLRTGDVNILQKESSNGEM